MTIKIIQEQGIEDYSEIIFYDCEYDVELMLKTREIEINKTLKKEETKKENKKKKSKKQIIKRCNKKLINILEADVKYSRKKGWVARVENLKLEYQVEMLKIENALLRDRVKDLNRLLDTKQKNDIDIEMNNKKFDTIRKIIIAILVTIGISIYWISYFNCRYMTETYIDNTKAKNVNNNIIEGTDIKGLDIDNSTGRGNE